MLYFKVMKILVKFYVIILTWNVLTGNEMRRYENEVTNSHRHHAYSQCDWFVPNAEVADRAGEEQSCHVIDASNDAHSTAALETNDRFGTKNDDTLPIGRTKIVVVLKLRDILVDILDDL